MVTGRKRQRPVHHHPRPKLLTSLGVGVLCLSQIEAFSPWDVSLAQQQRVAPKRALAADILEAAVRRENEASMAIVPSIGIPLDNDEPKKLPPWLSRYELVSSSQISESMDWLEVKLLHRGWDVPDVQVLRETVFTASNGDFAIAAGCIDFLKTFLEIEEDSPAFVTQTILLAAVQHYVDCIAVRNQGIQGLVRQVMLKEEPNRLLGSTQQPDTSIRRLHDYERQDVALTTCMKPEKSVQVLSIEESAASIKRAEILASVFLGASDWSDPHSADHIRSLLLSVTGDFRGLVIRIIACLYRLEGVIEQHPPGLVGQYAPKTRESIRAAKEGIQIYATFAERMGLQNLKAKIEDAAFRILYRRQYNVVLSLYLESGQVMKSVANHLEREAQEMLCQDEVLMNQLEHIDIDVRVKQPFSLWKKLLNKGSTKRDELVSFQQVHDVVAMRVILRASRTTGESQAETSEREHLLCYYVQNILRQRWGTIRQKDYIKSPKPNGYQSLHHTSMVRNMGVELPFEVQVRSEEMHHAAEFGTASHWHYKLGNALAAAKEDESSETLLLAPSNDDTTLETVTPASSTQSPTASYLDALVVAQDTMQHVYIFTADQDNKKGRLVSLPTNSNVQEALRALDQEDSSSEKIIWKNGNEALPEDVIENGDVLWVASRELTSI